jgi:transposase
MIKDFILRSKSLFVDVLNKISGQDKRSILAHLAKEIGYSGQTFISEEFDVSRNTIRKGLEELKSGVQKQDAFHKRGRHKVEERLPDLLQDIKDIAESQSQTDPKFQSTRLYTRLTTAEFRKQLIVQKGYTADELPTLQTLNTKINKLGYNMKRIQKTKPLKKIAETDDIFDKLKEIHEKAKNDDSILRLSIDTKDRVKIGDFSRDGKSRVTKKATDHDFGDKYVTPFGILNVKSGSVDISIAKSKVTADFMVDRLEEYLENHVDLNNTKLLLMNADNGSENSSRRTQFIKRMVELSLKYKLPVLLAYYPPYHSKYNPIEHVWGTLEQHWNGDILDSIDTVVKFTESMTWKGKNPTVNLIDELYETGIRVSKKIMKMYESAICRMNGLKKWFVLIRPEGNKMLCSGSVLQ